MVFCILSDGQVFFRQLTYKLREMLSRNDYFPGFYNISLDITGNSHIDVHSLDF